MIYIILAIVVVLIVLTTCYALSNAATEADRYTDLFYEQMDKETIVKQTEENNL